MIEQEQEYTKNCEQLDGVIRALEDVISGKAILDY